MTVDELTIKIIVQTAQAKAGLGGLKTDLQQTERAGVQAADNIGAGMIGLGSKLLAAGSSLGVFLAAWQALKASINVASELEQAKIRLESLYGSQEKAAAILDKIKAIAETTPYAFKEVLEGGITLKSFGMDVEKTLKPVADLAAFMGTDLVMAAQSVGRAFAGGVGAADVLRERGVLELIKSFKGIEDLSKLTLPEFRKILIETIQDPAAGIAGATDKLSKSFSGALSNMGDAIDKLADWAGSKLLPTLTSAARRVTELVTAITPVSSKIEEVTRKSAEQRSEFEKLVVMYNNLRGVKEKTKVEYEQYKDVISRLIQISPDLQKILTDEKSNLDDVAKAFENVRQAMIAKYKAEAAGAEAKDIYAEQVGSAKNIKKLNEEIAKQQVLIDEQKNKSDAAIAANAELVKKGLQTELDMLHQKTFLEKEASGLTERQTILKALFNREIENYKKLDQDAMFIIDANEEAFKKYGISIGDVTQQQKKSGDEIVSQTGKYKKLLNQIKELGDEQVRIGKLKGTFYNTQRDPELAKVEEKEKENLANLANDFKNVNNLAYNFSYGLTQAAIAGENMGGAVTNALKNIAAQAAALVIVFGVLQLIPGGSAFAGLFSSFMAKGFGFSGAAGSSGVSGSPVITPYESFGNFASKLPATVPIGAFSNSNVTSQSADIVTAINKLASKQNTQAPVVVVQGALPGQEFYAKTVAKQAPKYNKTTY